MLLTWILYVLKSFKLAQVTSKDNTLIITKYFSICEEKEPLAQLILLPI